MRPHWLFKRFPTAERLRESRLLRPFARYLDHHSLWQFNRRGVAGGLAVGLFFGILVPFLQIFLAAFVAILLRVNLPVAAFSTLITNPFTFPAIYYFAYRLGSLLTGSATVASEEMIEADIEQMVATQQGDVQGWLPGLLDWVQSVGLSLGLGLFVMATSAALIGYFAVSTFWKWQIRWRWRQRQMR